MLIGVYTMEKVKLLIKGMLMGIADMIPGISGGTVAFITGIYESLISNIERLTMVKWTSNPFALARNVWQNIAFSFFIPLLAGIALAAFGLSHVVGYLLAFHLSFTYSFFIGLILASILLIVYRLKHTLVDWIGFIVGFLVGLLISDIATLALPSTPLIIFLSGAIATSILLLPGISGAYVLLLLGQYETVIGILRSPIEQVGLLFMLLLGIGVGALVAARGIGALLRRHRTITLHVLAGLVIGSLRVFSPGLIPSFWNILYVLIGVVIVVGIDYAVQSKKSHK